MTVALFLSAAVALTPGPALRTTPAVRPAVAPALLAAASDESDKAIVSKPVAIAIAAIAIGGGAVYGPAIVNNPIMQKAAKKAIGGGLSGALAGVVQVLALMWMRTVRALPHHHQPPPPFCRSRPATPPPRRPAAPPPRRPAAPY